MLWFEWVLGISVIVVAAILLVLVLMQTGKDKKLSGTIAGGSSDTYLGKGSGKSREKVLTIITTVVAIVFAVLVVATYVIITKNTAAIRTAIEEAAKAAK